jgi:gluconate 2-dehydrogenase gamma chain
MKRRDFLERSAGGAMVGFLGATLADLRAAGEFAAAAAPERPYEFLTPDQVTLLDAITAQIVPTDDTPGAREAHVVRFIDHALATFLQPRRANLLLALSTFEAFAAKWKDDGTPFHKRTDADQVSLLKDFEKAKPEQFAVFRNMTMAGMFSQPQHGGNTGRIGWKMIGYEDRYSWAPPFGYYDR